MEWYGNQMYVEKHAAFGYHRQRFGDQKTFGYKDVIPKFTAPKFNADEWAELFARAGAKFAGPVAVHHDKFAMWDSQVTRWNSVAMGPHRDITGELEKAIRKRGMKLITTFHHGFAWQYYEPAYAFDAADGKNADLYGDPHEKGKPPNERFLKAWLAMVDEVLAKYKPDLTWFDFELQRVIPVEYQRLMFAARLQLGGEGASRDRCRAQVPRDSQAHRHPRLRTRPRGQGDRLRLAHRHVGGSLVPPQCAGIPDHQRPGGHLRGYRGEERLPAAERGPSRRRQHPGEGARRCWRQLGGWMKVNGEAIYGSRPWQVYGEGPTRNTGAASASERTAHTPSRTSVSPPRTETCMPSRSTGRLPASC